MQNDTQVATGENMESMPMMMIMM